MFTQTSFEVLKFSPNSGLGVYPLAKVRHRRSSRWHITPFGVIWTGKMLINSAVWLAPRAVRLGMGSFIFMWDFISFFLFY